MSTGAEDCAESVDVRLEGGKAVSFPPPPLRNGKWMTIGHRPPPFPERDFLEGGAGGWRGRARLVGTGRQIDVATENGGTRSKSRKKANE